MRPHYVSPYFPGHALWLAAGRLLTGSAWAGVLAQCGIFLAVLYWMLRAWMPSRWALFGVLLAGLRFAIGSYWINNLHGGFLPAIGGALVAGAFARLRKQSSVTQGFVLGLGMAILMSTRPVEGAFFIAFRSSRYWCGISAGTSVPWQSPRCPSCCVPGRWACIFPTSPGVRS